jgi:hypothetical protein
MAGGLVLSETIRRAVQTANPARHWGFAARPGRRMLPPFPLAGLAQWQSS